MNDRPSLYERRAEMEVIPAAQEYGVGVIPWSPPAGGLLGGVLRKEHAKGAQGGRPAEGWVASRVAGAPGSAGSVTGEPGGVEDEIQPGLGRIEVGAEEGTRTSSVHWSPPGFVGALHRPVEGATITWTGTPRLP